MKLSQLAEYALVGAIFLVVAVLLLGNLLGQPILLSYVETGSMAPTLQPGDGFIAIPATLTGPIEPGDVIVFDAENLHDGGLVTHRVIAQTEQGYITKGDANPTTDQDSIEPPVRDAQIVATALQIGGKVVVIPKIGLTVVLVNEVLTAVQHRLAALFNTRSLLGTQGIAYLLFGVGVGSYLVSELLARRSGRDRDRQAKHRPRRSRGRGIALVVVLAFVTILFVTASMTVPGGTQEFGVVSSTADSPGPGVIQTGQSESFTYRVPSNGILPVVVILEPASEGLEVNPDTLYVAPTSVSETIVELHAPAETGYYRRYLVEHRYLAILPRELIVSLYQIHAWLPILVIDVLVGVGFVGIGLALLDQGWIRARSRNVPLVERIRRWLD